MSWCRPSRPAEWPPMANSPAWCPWPRAWTPAPICAYRPAGWAPPWPLAPMRCPGSASSTARARSARAPALVSWFSASCWKMKAGLTTSPVTPYANQGGLPRTHLLRLRPQRRQPLLDPIECPQGLVHAFALGADEAGVGLHAALHALDHVLGFVVELGRQRAQQF